MPKDSIAFMQVYKIFCLDIIVQIFLDILLHSYFETFGASLTVLMSKSVFS